MIPVQIHYTECWKLMQKLVLPYSSCNSLILPVDGNENWESDSSKKLGSYGKASTETKTFYEICGF